MDPYDPMLPDSYYHVYNRGNAFENLFLRDENYHFFLAKCERYISQVATLYSYALLPNHFHFLIRTHTPDKILLQNNEDFSSRISRTFSNLFNSYTKSFNVYYRRRGTLFTPNFRRLHIDTMEYRLNTVLYLHGNGVHHRYCKTIDEWPFTSHHRIVYDPSENNHAELLSWFGGLDGYLDMCKKYNFSDNKDKYIEETP